MAEPYTYNFYVVLENKFMSAFVLKIFAFIFMVIDHSTIVFDMPVAFRCIGRLAFPIFAYLTSQGCTYTKNFRKYIFRLFVCAVLSEYIYDIVFNEEINFFYDLNIVFTLFISCLGIYIFEIFRKEIKCSWVGYFVIIVFCGIAEILHFDYGFAGVGLIFLFYISKNKAFEILALATFVIVKFYPVIFGSLSHFFYIKFFYIFEPYVSMYNIGLTVGTFFAGAFILLYNGKKGFHIKNLFYIAYPLHILILFVLREFCVG